MRFYEKVMRFKMVVDQDWSKIYKVSENGYLGLVDGAKGYHKANNIKPVIFCLNVTDAEAWYRRVTKAGVAIEEKLQESQRLKVKVFMFRDPEGYVIEIQQSLPGALSI
jgi:predicted enzyme related to lactoylglutathione lyase